MNCGGRLSLQCGFSHVIIDSDATFSKLKETIWLKKREGHEITIIIAPTMNSPVNHQSVDAANLCAADA